ncbi:MAG TPA: efflux RND transporter periplasmic adaptor subunit [Solimonas sp.]|nr:efflux RND transporter periplasmic adaptor subunit [Solimonas sp.]
MNKTLTLTGLILATALLAGCPDDKKDEKKEEASIPVETAKVRTGAIDAAYRGTATLEAEEEATVNAKTGGVIESIQVEEGDHVRAGQVLARMETDKLRMEVARARATRDNLEAAFKRNESVFQRNLVSREAYDKTRADLDVARAAHDIASLALRDTEIKAPFDGMVSLRHIKAGNQIQPGNPAFRITRMDRLQAQIYVPERDIHKIAAKQAATLTVDAWPGKEFHGEILRVNPVVDAQTGTVKVTVAMGQGQVELKPGMFGRIEIRYDRREQALLVPKDAVLTEDAANAVFVVAGGKAHRRPLKLGYSDGELYEVLEGLKDGEEVVVTGQTNLKDEAKVEVVNGPVVAPEKAQAVADKKS